MRGIKMNKSTTEKLREFKDSLDNLTLDLKELPELNSLLHDIRIKIDEQLTIIKNTKRGLI